MNTFAQVVGGWHDYYHVVGDAAAALMGLLFVSLSLNVEEITKKVNSGLRILAAQSFTSFLCLVMFSLLFEIPDQGPRGLGIPMLGIDLILFYVTCRRFLALRHQKSRLWVGTNPLVRFIIPMVCFIAIMIIAITVLSGTTGGLYYFVPVSILLIFDASLDAWDLLLRLHVPQ